MDWLDSLARGEPNAEAVERFAKAFRRWWISGGSDAREPIGLHRFLGLPKSPEAARLALRDWHLRRAGAALHINRPWQRAQALHAAVAAFMGRRWPCWVDLPEPPPWASEVEALLWHAAKAGGGRMPTTARRMDHILKA